MSVFNQTVTVVNYNSEAQTYSTHVLEGCMWRSKVAKKVENGQLSLTRYYSVTIPEQEGYTDDISAGGWTLDETNNQDLLILGELKEEVNESNYESILKRKNVGIISSVADNTLQGELKHWKVVCV